MPSFVFFEKDESIHKELIQMTYKSWLSDDYNNDLIRIILKDSKKVRVNLSIFKLFSSSFGSLLSANSSVNSVILLPDFDVECLNCLIEILTEGTTRAKTFKNPNDEVKDIKCLAQCLGIDLRNLMLEQNLKILPKESLRIKTFSHIFNYAEVPNILSDASKGNNIVEEDMTNLNQPSPGNLLEMMSGDDEEALMDYSLMMAEEALDIKEDLVNTSDPRPSSRGEASTNQTRPRTWTRWGPELDNNNINFSTIDKNNSHQFSIHSGLLNHARSCQVKVKRLKVAASHPSHHSH